MDESVFTRIIKGEIPCHKIYEDDRVISFLSINPFSRGHTLVIPKNQVDQIWDLDDEDYQYLMSVVKKLGMHIRSTLGCERVGIAVKGFEVPHVHVHLVPLASSGSGVSLDQSNVPRADDAELAQIADELKFND